MRVKDFVRKINGKLLVASVMAGNMIMPLTAHASFSAWNGSTGTGVVDGFKDMMAKLATYGGGMYLIGAIFTLVLSVRNEDTEGRNKAILNLLAAIALLSMGSIYTLFMN